MEKEEEIEGIMKASNASPRCAVSRNKRHDKTNEKSLLRTQRDFDHRREAVCGGGDRTNNLSYSEESKVEYIPSAKTNTSKQNSSTTSQAKYDTPELDQECTIVNPGPALGFGMPVSTFLSNDL